MLMGSHSFSYIVDAGRILFSLFFIIKLACSVDSSSIFWALGTPSKTLHRLLLTTAFGSATALLLGFMSPLAALLLFLSYISLTRYSAIYCLEDVVFQSLALYFALTSPGQSLSLDAQFGISLWTPIFEDTVLPEIFLLIASGLIFFTAGIEKLKTEMWRKGLGCYFFFLLPNVRRIPLKFIVNSRPLMLFMNHLTLFFEIAFLPLLLINYWPLGAFVWLLAVGFGLSLIVFFVVDWIGQGEAIMLAIIGALIFMIPGENATVQLLNELEKIQHPLQWLLTGFIFLTLIAATFSILGSFLGASFEASAFQGFMKKLSRFTWGIVPVSAFNELHLKGPVVYQVLDGGQEDLPVAWPIFLANGRPGPARPFRPTYYETMTNKITDVCLELDTYGEIRNPSRWAFLKGHAEFARKKSKHYLGRTPDRLVYRITQLHFPLEFKGFHENFLSDWTVDAFAILFDSSGEAHLEVLKTPCLKYPTGRSLARETFRFAPEVKIKTS